MPFAGYTDFEDCVAKNKDKGDPKAYCGYIKHKVEEAIQEAGVSSEKCYDWEGNEVDCQTKQKIGSGYSQSKKYKKFLNETQENLNHNLQEASIDWKQVPHDAKITKGGSGYMHDGKQITWNGQDAADANHYLYKRATQETEEHFQRLVTEGNNQYLNSAKNVKETMETPKRLCECKEIKETEAYLNTHKATKSQRHLVSLANRMTDENEKKKAFEFVENDIKETEGSHQSDGDGLPSIPTPQAQQTSHAMSGGSQMKEAEFDMTTCVSNAIANGASPEAARATCSAKQGTMEMVKEAIKPYLTKIQETEKMISGFKDAVTALDNKIQETLKNDKTKSRTLEFTKTDGPGGAVIRETQPMNVPTRPKSDVELMDVRREIEQENDSLSDNGGTPYQ
jgi:hypothetical protein